MSTLRNAAPRRPHRERTQPTARSKWGLLEKHRDYALRAADYNAKKRKLTQLSVKARDRHPDEFAFGMMGKENTRQGKHGKGGRGNELGVEAVRLLKSQDAGYLRVLGGRGRKEIRRVEEEVGLGVDGREAGRKVVFDAVEQGAEELDGNERLLDGPVDAENEAEAEVEDVVEEDALEVKIPAPRPLSKKALAKEQDTLARLKVERKRRKRLQEMRVAKLEILKKRQKEIMAVADQLDEQRAKMARTVGGVNKNGVKFKVRERKR